MLDFNIKIDIHLCDVHTSIYWILTPYKQCCITSTGMDLDKTNIPYPHIHVHSSSY